MSDDIHDLLREIDKALEQVRAVGARDADLSLKLPLAAREQFRALIPPFAPIGAGSKYCGIPITEWTDGPFMSFSLDHSVTLHNDPMLPPTFYGKGIRDLVFGDPAKSCGVVISSRGPEYYLVPPKGMDMPAPVDLPREWNPMDHVQGQAAQVGVSGPVPYPRRELIAR